MCADVFADGVFRGDGALSCSSERPTRRRKGRQLRAAADAGVHALESRVLMSASVIQAVTPFDSGAAATSVTIGGITYFTASDSVHGREVWRTDGTAAGTSLVADLNPGPGDSDPVLFTFNDALYIAAYDGTRKNLYRSDGTPAGTTVVFQEAKTGLRTEPWDFTAVGNELYFLGDDAGGNEDLYRTDGTADGTVQVLTVIPGQDSEPIGIPIVPSLANLDGTLYFSSTSLWKLDPNGQTELITNFGAPNFPQGNLVAVNHHLFFQADDPNNANQLDYWVSDGTAAGTRILWADPASGWNGGGGYQAAGDYLYFVTQAADFTEQIYRTDGTTAGTVPLTAAGAALPIVGSFTVAGGRTYFAAQVGGNYPTLWITDGTAAGTRPVDSSITLNNGISQDNPLASANGLLYFVGKSYLCETDGTSIGLVDSTQSAEGWSAMDVLGVSANGLVFSATDPQHGEQLWAVSTQVTSPPAPIPPPAPTPPWSSPLVPTLGRVSLTPQAVAGSKLNAIVPVVITNSGTALKGDVTVKLYAETATTLDGTQVLLASRTRHVSLKANQHATFPFSLKSLPTSRQDGTYHIVAQVIDASGETNAIATSQTVQVAAPSVQPELSILGITPASIAPGRRGAVVVSVTNQGNARSTAGRVTLSLSPNGTNASEVTLVTVDAGLVIPAGKTRRFRLRFKLPATLPAGTYFASAAVSLDGTLTAVTSASPLTVT